MRALLFMTLAAASAGCLRKTEYHCTSSAQCTGNPGGTCEATTYCSFSDTSCPSGQRYGEFAGELSNQCAGDEVVGGDGGVDSPTVDTPPGACPVGYAAISGGGTHVYKKLAQTNASWQTQHDRCAGDGANVHLAIPDDANELAGIRMLAAAPSWVGINDLANEGQYVTIAAGNPAATFLPWAATEPDDTMGGQDCVSALAGVSQIQTDKCTDLLAAVCECTP